MEKGVSDPQTYAIIGAAIEVHNVRGTGFLEIVYRDCCAVEFTERKLPFRMDVPFPLTYKGHSIGGVYRADFVCFDDIVVEIKAHTSKNLPADQAQMLNYLAASGKPRGLLLNFGGPKLTFQRFVMSSNHGTVVNVPAAYLIGASEERCES
jgi:GxxExxY protein